MEPRDSSMDNLLRTSLAAPVPSLRADFEKRLTRKLRRDSQVLGRYRRLILAAYALVSAVTSAIIMRGQGLGWTATAVMILGPLAVMAITVSTRQVKRVSV